MSWGDLVPPAAWGLIFFKILPEESWQSAPAAAVGMKRAGWCHGGGSPLLCEKHPVKTVLQRGYTNLALLRKKAVLPPCRPPQWLRGPTYGPTCGPMPCHRLPGCVGRVGVLAATRVPMPRVPGDSPPCWDPLAWLNLSTTPCPGTQTVVLDQLAPICFSLVRRTRPGQPACSHASLGSPGVVTAL